MEQQCLSQDLDLFWRESGRKPRLIAKQIVDTIQLGISIAVTN